MLKSIFIVPILLSATKNRQIFSSAASYIIMDDRDEAHILPFSHDFSLLDNAVREFFFFSFLWVISYKATATSVDGNSVGTSIKSKGW